MVSNTSSWRMDSGVPGTDCVRYDLARFSPGTTRTPQGFLKAPAFLTRSGVFEYTRADGTVVKELRPEDEVFKEDSLATLQSSPLVREHPEEGMVTPLNAKRLAIGWTGEKVERKDTMVATTVTIMDSQIIDEVLANTVRDISMGYRCRVDATPGVHPKYGAYDQIQRDIKYNHVALVDLGRAGKEVGLRLDAEGAIQRRDSRSSLELLVKQQMELKGLKMYELAKLAGVSEWEIEDILWGYGTPKKEDLQKIAKAIEVDVKILINLVPRVDRADRKKTIMETIIIGGVEFEVPKAAAQAFRGVQTRTDSEVSELKAENEKLKGRSDAQTEELKTMKTKLEEASDPKRLDSAVADRIALVAKARKVLGEEAEIVGTPRTIQELVLRKDNADLDLTGKSDDYVEARFDGFMDNFSVEDKPAEGNKGQTRADAHDAAAKGGAGKPDAEAARERMKADNAKAWEQPLTCSTQTPTQS